MRKSGSAKSAKDKRGTCKYCGCMDATACQTEAEACSWVNKAETVCSACLGKAIEEDKLFSTAEAMRLEAQAHD